MRKFATFANSISEAKEVSEETFNNFKERMKVAAKANAINRKKAIQSASKIILTR